MILKDKKILVVGLAASGLAACNFLTRRGAHVCVTDIKTEAELKDQLAQLEGPVRLALGGHREEDFTGAEMIVLSPGVPTSLPELGQAAGRGIPIYAEVELACRFLQGTLIGVTGSNGKTTTTTLIGELFKNSGKETVVAGNIGPPLTRFIEEHRQETTLFVVELSSFQLETIEQLRCHIAAVLNVTPDHLDRHTRLEDYLQAKERIFLNQDAEDYAVLNADNPSTRAMAGGRRSQVMLFSRREALEEGVFVREESIQVAWKNRRHCVMPTREIRLKGNHNLENVLAATAVGFLSGLEVSVMADTFRAFSGVEHRLEWVRRLRGVDFYNDSKATNVDSAYQAICAFEQPLLLIMGGKDKGGDFTALREAVAARVKLLILVGAASEKIFAALGQVVPTLRASDMQEAVEQAQRQAGSGDVVLLSPGCASFDMFENFEHRGKVFKELVRNLL